MNNIIRQEFARRVLIWAQHEAAWQIQAGFPLLHDLAKNGHDYAIGLLRHMSEIGPDKSASLVMSIVKHAHPSGVQATSEPISSEEERLYEQYMRDPEYSLHDWLVGEYDADSSRDEEQVATKYLRELVAAEFAHVCDENIVRLGRNEWCYITVIQQWEVHTSVDCGGRFHRLSVCHRICAAPHVPLAEAVSPLIGTGLSGVLNWTRVAQADVGDIVSCTGRLCSRFLGGAKSWLMGLSPQEYMREGTLGREARGSGHGL